jgi:hypothetical protein
MLKFLFLILIVFNNCYQSNFINKLLDQSLSMKISLSASVIYHCSFALFKQYHLRFQHKNYNECARFSGHYVQNIPLLNILFYVNGLAVKLILQLTEKQYEDICYFNRGNDDIVTYKNNCNPQGFFTKNNFLEGFDLILLLFLFIKLAHIKYQS